MLQTEGGEEGCRGQGRHAQVGEEGEAGALLTVGFVFVFVFEEVSTFGGVGHCQTPGNWPHFICVDQILKPFFSGPRLDSSLDRGSQQLPLGAEEDVPLGGAGLGRRDGEEGFPVFAGRIGLPAVRRRGHVIGTKSGPKPLNRTS